MAALTASSGRAAANSASLAANSATRRSWRSWLLIGITQPQNLRIGKFGGATLHLIAGTLAKLMVFLIGGDYDVKSATADGQGPVRVPVCPPLSDNWAWCRTPVRRSADERGAAATGNRASLRTDDAVVESRTGEHHRASRRACLARLCRRRAGVQGHLGCVALGDGIRPRCAGSDAVGTAPVGRRAAPNTGFTNA